MFIAALCMSETNSMSTVSSNAVTAVFYVILLFLSNISVVLCTILYLMWYYTVWMSICALLCIVLYNEFFVFYVK